MVAYDRELCESIFNALIKQHKIKVHFWKNKHRGLAFIESKRIKVPKPECEKTFGICMHEIHHIVLGKVSPQFQAEFECENFALTMIRNLDYQWQYYWMSSNWYVLHHIAKFLNGGGIVDKIGMDIRLFYPEINFDEWRNKKIWINYDPKADYGYRYELLSKLSEMQVAAKLKDMDLKLFKTDNGNYIIHFPGQTQRYSNLNQIIKNFEL